MSKQKKELRIRELTDEDLVETLREAVLEANEELYDARHRLSQQLQIAARVHHSLLPSAIDHPGIQVDMRYLPVNALSGDYFQVRFSDDASICYITMCHVTGDGIAPALLASRISSEARHFIEEEYCPSDMIHALNRFIYEYFRDFHMHISFIASQIELERRIVTYSGAGNPGGILLRPDKGVVHRFASQHCSIGMHPDILTRESECKLQTSAGDRILFYAEGITQYLNQDNVPLGQQNLAGIAADTMSQDLCEMLDAILHEVHVYRNGSPANDVTMVVAEIK